MVTHSELIQLKIYVLPPERDQAQTIAGDRQLSVSRYFRSLLAADVEGQGDRHQRIDQHCRQLIRDLTALQLDPNSQNSPLLANSIERAKSIQKEVRGA